jgi:hypothetical protein
LHVVSFLRRFESVLNDGIGLTLPSIEPQIPASDGNKQGHKFKAGLKVGAASSRMERQEDGRQKV